jgi:hypothetical protein
MPMSRSLFMLAVLGLASCSAAPQLTLGQIDANAANNSVDENRKVIVEALIKLAVPSLSILESEVPKLTKQHGGYLAQAAVDRTQGMHLKGRWVARIPVKQFEAFVDEISKLGVAESFDQHTQDVTEEYVDLETRIANEKQLETRILSLLTKNSDEIKDVIEVERELARVRGEIEKMQGRLTFLANRTEYTTVTIEAVEREKYVPPRALTFFDRITQAFLLSLNTLRDIGQAAVISLVFLSPWLLIVPIVAITIRWSLRRHARFMKAGRG